MCNKFFDFQLIAIGVTALLLSLSLSLFGFISMFNRGSGRIVIAEQTPTPEETIKTGDGRRDA